MAAYSIVFLDADNTLFDFDASEHAALCKAMAAFSLPFPPEAEDYYKRVNIGLWKQYEMGETTQEKLCVKRFEKLLSFLRADETQGEKVNQTYERFLSQSSILLPGALDFCRRLSRHCPLYLLTNGIAAIQESRMALSPIRPYISRMFISQFLGYRKPQKEFFDRVFEALHITPAEKKKIVMAGDSLHSDILGGQNAGLDTIWMNFSGAALEGNIHPTWEAASFDEMEKIILGRGF